MRHSSQKIVEVWLSKKMTETLKKMTETLKKMAETLKKMAETSASRFVENLCIIIPISCSYLMK